MIPDHQSTGGFVTAMNAADNENKGIGQQHSKLNFTSGTGIAMPVSGLHETAIHLAFKGIAVFPLRPNTRKAFGENTAREATVDLSMIRQWWTTSPNANIGMSTSGFLVLDVDVKDGVNGFNSLKRLKSEYGSLPITLTQTTPSGGVHYIFRNATGKHLPSRRNCPAPGIDVRGDGGYIVVAPSIIDGITYTWDDHPIADAPDWLPGVIDSVPINLGMLEGSIKGNSRKRFLFDIARECSRNRLTWEQAEDRVLMANYKCFPAFERKELDIYLKIAHTEEGGRSAKVHR